MFMFCTKRSKNVGTGNDVTGNQIHTLHPRVTHRKSASHLNTTTPHISSASFFSSSSSSSSSSFSSFLSSAAFLLSSSSFFLAFSTSLNAFHFFANVSASALSSVTIMLSKMVPAFTCHKSKPRKPKSAYSETLSSSTYSGFAIFFASQIPLYAGLEIRLPYQSPLYASLSFIGASHSPSSSSSQSSGFFASVSTIRFSSTQSSGFLSSGSSIMELSTQSLGFLSSGSEISFAFNISQSSFRDPP